MPHPEIDNCTPFAFEPLYVSDEDGRPIVVTIVKATLDVSARGAVRPAEEQVAVDFAGVPHGEPGKSSYRFEPETAFMKPSTDCVLLGHAVASRPTRQMDVGFGVGPVGKTVRVTGDRFFENGLVGARISEPTLFEKVPLVFERAFGGWDRTPADEVHHACEARNPVGVGFAVKHGHLVDGSALPNIEDPQKPMTGFGDVCAPTGFGFIGHDWQPRAKLAGTYDDAWAKNRSPLLPKDFDRRFMQGASEGLVTPAYLRGDEAVVVAGATPEGRWEFRLPGYRAPVCTIALRLGSDQSLVTNLDTVIVDADARRVTLLWRAFVQLRSGPHDVGTIRIHCSNAPAPAAIASSSSAVASSAA